MTFFVAPLTCPRCGRISPEDTSTRMSNDLSSRPDGEILRAGDEAEYVTGEFESSFLVLRRPAPGEPIHVLQDWRCPFCGAHNWADVVFADGRIQSITAVPFDRASLARAHYISDGVHEYYERVTGRQLYHAYDGCYTRLIEELLQRPDRPG